MKMTRLLIVMAMLMSVWLVGCDKEDADGTGANQSNGSSAKMEQPATATADQAEGTADNATINSMTPVEGSETKKTTSGGSDTKTPTSDGSGTKDQGSGTK